MTSPLKIPVMECAPTANPAVTQVAVAATSGRATQPAMFTPASWKVTVPVGTGPIPVTTAVKVIDWPNTDGFTEDVTVVVEGDAAAADMVPRETMTRLSATAKNAGPMGYLEELSGLTRSRSSVAVWLDSDRGRMSRLRIERKLERLIA